VQRRLRDLPSRVGVYFLLAMCLFPEVGYRLVRDKLTVGLSGMQTVRPSTKALRDLRRRRARDRRPSLGPHKSASPSTGSEDTCRLFLSFLRAESERL